MAKQVKQPKQWRIVKRLPTTTSAIHWHIQVNGENYVACISDRRRLGWYSSTYTGTKTGHISEWSPITQAPGNDPSIGICRLLDKFNIEHTQSDVINEIEKINKKYKLKHG